MIKKLFVSLCLLFAIISAYKYLFNYDNLNQPAPDWQKQYLRLANNVGYIRLAASVPISQTKSILQQELIGKITNNFAIRDDVLKLILNFIPESDVMSTIATIKMAQYYQQQIGVTDEKEMNLLANKAAAAVSCQNLSIIDSYNFGKAYDEIIRDTPARKLEQDRIERLLSNHIISADCGTQSDDHTARCNYFLAAKS